MATDICVTDATADGLAESDGFCKVGQGFYIRRADGTLVLAGVEDCPVPNNGCYTRVKYDCDTGEFWLPGAGFPTFDIIGVTRADAIPPGGYPLTVGPVATVGIGGTRRNFTWTNPYCEPVGISVSTSLSVTAEIVNDTGVTWSVLARLLMDGNPVPGTQARAETNVLTGVGGGVMIQTFKATSPTVGNPAEEDEPLTCIDPGQTVEFATQIEVDSGGPNPGGDFIGRFASAIRVMTTPCCDNINTVYTVLS